MKMIKIKPQRNIDIAQLRDKILDTSSELVAIKQRLEAFVNEYKGPIRNITVHDKKLAA